MEHKIISPKNDIIFKALFGRNDDILMNFLSDTLGIPLSEIEGLKVANSEIVPTTSEGKLTRLDIRLSTKSHDIDIEMQKAKENAYRERILCYWANMYSEGIKKGENYSGLNQTISLNILDFNMFDCEEYQSLFMIYEKTRRELFSDKLALYFFELRKVGDNVDVNDRKKLWLQLINANTSKELENLENTNISIIRKSIDTIYRLNDDDEIREMIRLREEADARERSLLHDAREEGITKGRAERDSEILLKMQALGMSDSQIRAILGEPKS